VTYVITQNCCNDAACVPACPVNCIHPTPGEAGYATTEMLYIDPTTCIDCGACFDVCPVDAILPEHAIPPHALVYKELNALYYRCAHQRDSIAHAVEAEHSQKVSVRPTRATELRVAIVGSGPAACYAAEELLSQRGVTVSVDMFERLTTPWGLVRFGVAPDHQKTKAIVKAFEGTARREGFRMFLNVEVGRDIAHVDLAARYHAVVYAVGATGSRTLDIPGEKLKGCHSATELVGWYNGHPDYAEAEFDFSCERAVILGNGNVALDIARVLLTDVDSLSRTDIADHAIQSLRKSRIREVMIVGRRGPRQAAFTTPELIGLRDVSGVVVRVDPAGVPIDGDECPAHSSVWFKERLISQLVAPISEIGRTITLRFCASPTRVLGGGRVEGIRLARNELMRDGKRVRAVQTTERVDMACGLVLSAVGYRGRRMLGLPFDDERAIIPNVRGRVTEENGLEQVPGAYVTGWIKRGPSGVIGTNKQCARETVAALLDDWAAGRLAQPDLSLPDASEKLPGLMDMRAWRAIDDYEQRAGRATFRPRAKLVDRGELMAVAREALTSGRRADLSKGR
jgi:ferredoxin--NADP+ reductase